MKKSNFNYIKASLALVIGLALVQTNASAFAQTPESAITQPSNASASTSVTIPANTAVLLSNNEELRSGLSKTGDTVTYTVLADVKAANGQVVIPAGSLATGTVIDSEHTGLVGKNGKLVLTCDSVKASDGSQIPFANPKWLSAGGGNSPSIIGIILLSPLIIILVHGNDVIYQPGHPITMMTASDTNVNVSSSTAASNGSVSLAESKKSKSPYTCTIQSYDASTVTVSTDSGSKTLNLKDIPSIQTGSQAMASAN